MVCLLWRPVRLQLNVVESSVAESEGVDYGCQGVVMLMYLGCLVQLDGAKVTVIDCSRFDLDGSNRCEVLRGATSYVQLSHWANVAPDKECNDSPELPVFYTLKHR